MEINEKILKISGKANLPQELEIGKSYDLTIANCECRKSEDIPTDEGTIDRVFTVKASSMSIVGLIHDKGIIMTKPRKGSQAQALRMAMYKLWSIAGEDDFEDFYQREMSKIIKDYSE